MRDPFLKAIEQTLGDRYSDRMRNIYEVFIDYLVKTMCEGYNSQFGLTDTQICKFLTARENQPKKLAIDFRNDFHNSISFQKKAAPYTHIQTTILAHTRIQKYKFTPK